MNIISTRIQELIAYSSDPSSIHERRRRLLNIILWAFNGIILMWFMFLFFYTAFKDLDNVGYQELLTMMAASLIMFVGFLALIWLNRLLEWYWANIVFVALIFLDGFVDFPYQIVAGRTGIVFALSIIVASVLIKPWAGFVVAVLSTLANVIIAYLIVGEDPNSVNILTFFLLATFIWLATSSLEFHIKGTEMANNALRESEERYRMLVEISPYMVSLARTDGTLTMINQAGLDLMGYATPDEMLGQKVWDFVTPSEQEGIKNQLDEIFQTGNLQLSNLETLATKKDGTNFYLGIGVSIIRDAAGKPQALLGVGRDISQQKLAEKQMLNEKQKLESTVQSQEIELNKANEKLRELLTYSPTVLWSCDIGDETLPFRFMSDNVSTILGFSPWELLDDQDLWKSRVHPDDLPRIESILNTIQDKGQIRLEYRFKHSDENYRWLHEDLRLVRDACGNPQELVGSWTDVTEQKQAEEALRNSEALIRSINNNLAGSMIFQVEFRPEGGSRFTYLSAGVMQMYGVTTEEGIANPDLIYGRVYPEDRDRILLAEKDSKETGSVFKVEARVINPDGSLRWSSFSSKPRHLENGILYWDGLELDITERKRMEEALRESEIRFENIFRFSPVGIAISNAGNGHFVDINDAFTSMFGYGREEIIGRSALDLEIWPDLAERGKFFSELQISRRISQYEAKFRNKSGKIGDQQVSMAIIDLNGSPHLLGIVSDITERKQMERSLQEANERLEQRVAERTSALVESQQQLRELAQKIVVTQEEERRRISRELHDEAGQALIGLKFRLDEALSKTPTGLQDVHQRISLAIKELDIAMQHIRGLAYDLRPPTLDIVGINLSLQGYCHEFAEQTDLVIKYNGVELQNVPDEVGISLYRILQEALTNIVKHARASRAQVSLKNGKGFIIFTVKDNGIGLDPASSQKGLGILGMKERLALLGGSLRVESAPGQGTSLRAVIPIHL
jgi:PAS domain S-box-containing protein